MEVAKAFCADQGWHVVEDVFQQESYDLKCTRGSEELHAEVKGTTTDGIQIVLTRNEVEHARALFPNAALIVVRIIQASSEMQASGGTVAYFSPWEIDQTHSATGLQLHSSI